MQSKYMGNVWGRHPADDIKPEDSASQTGQKSDISCMSAKAAAKKAALLVRARALKKRQELKLRQIELQQMEETMALETEIAEVEVEEQVLADFEGEKPRKIQPPVIVKTRRGSEYVKQEERENVKQRPVEFRSNVGVESSEYGAVGGEHSFQDRMSSYERILLLQQRMLNVMQLPNTELTKFDGDPLKYWMFVRAFENSLEGTGVSDSVKLNRLFQYCTGKALDVIECCAVMDPDIGYHEARKLLLERFGNQFVISKAWIQKITEGPPVKYNDNVGLRKYADAVRSCVVTLESMGRMSEVDNQIRMGAIVGKLPQHLQRRWRKQAVHHAKIKDCYPNISKLVEFIEMAAEEENDPVFGSINVQGENKHDKAKPQRVNFGRDSNFNVQATLGSQGNYSGSGSGQGQGSKFPPCKYCSGNHAIYICDKFKHLNISKRLEFVRANLLCFNCFSSQHMSYSCTKPSKCHVNGCVRKHSRLLHVSNPNNEDMAVQSSEQAGVNVTSGTQTLSVNNSMCGVNGAGLARVALPIVPVVVNVDGGKGYISTFALLDSGSTSTFCSEMLMKRLGFQGTKTTLSLTTLTGEGCKSDTSMISLDIADVSGRQLMHLPHVFVAPKLPILRNNMVTQVDVDKWPHLEGVLLPTVDHTNVELLIGTDTIRN